jgi:hypothetical protein
MVYSGPSPTFIMIIYIKNISAVSSSAEKITLIHRHLYIELNNKII